MEPKIKLFGFNNLAKSLSFNIYDICYAENSDEKQDYIQRVNNQYNAKSLTEILVGVAEKIEATVLNISKYDYDPQGSSAVMLIAEEPAAIAGHLDKSHITVHTYPEYHPDKSIATFRVDIDVATCGEILPLCTLDYIIGSFCSDIITLDYKVRGFTRSADGDKLFIDHGINSIQDYIHADILENYTAQDTNISQANIFHTRMIKKEIDVSNPILVREMNEIYNGRGA